MIVHYCLLKVYSISWQEPYITLMIPHYGPASGGTLIVIEGALFGDDVKIFFGSFQFFVHER